MKTCTRCKLEKDESEFHRNKSRKDGLASRCRTCSCEDSREQRKSHPEYSRMYHEHYNATHKQERQAYMRRYYDSHKEKWTAAHLKAKREHPNRRRTTHLRLAYGMNLSDYASLLEAQGGVCAICKNPPNGRPLFIDHDHETGAVRGLLCEKCNSGIGMFCDNPSLIENALRYLLP